MGLTFAEIVTGWLSGSMNSVFESFDAKGIPCVANKVLIDSLIIGFEFTNIPKDCVNAADCLSVAVTQKQFQPTLAIPAEKIATPVAGFRLTQLPTSSPFAYLIVYVI